MSPATSPPPSPRPTLTYSTHEPGEPIVSERGDGLAGIEIDIPPQIQRYWPPKTIGAWVGHSFVGIVALSPVFVTFWWWTMSGSNDPMAGPFFFLGLGGMAWPRPRHWPRSEIQDLRYTTRAGNMHFDGEEVVLFPANGREPTIVDGLQLLTPTTVRPLPAQLRQALALDPPPTIPKREESTL